MRFYKYHAAGNDFIITDDPGVTAVDAVRLCDRHTGIGADGLLLHRTVPHTDAAMIVVNADGSIAAMCGNGLRCFCRYLIEQRGLRVERPIIMTGNGPLPCLIEREGDRWLVAVDLGPATLEDRTADSWLVDIGNPHLVVIGDGDRDRGRDTAIALQREYDGDINVEVLLSIDRTARAVELIVNERGAGFTQACGTGGGAVTAALHRAGIVGDDEEWELHFPGGVISYRRAADGHLIMSGDAHFVFSGELHDARS